MNQLTKTGWGNVQCKKFEGVSIQIIAIMISLFDAYLQLIELVLSSIQMELTATVTVTVSLAWVILIPFFVHWFPFGTRIVLVILNTCATPGGDFRMLRLKIHQ